MIDDGLEGAVQRIADDGRREVVTRLRAALAHQADAAGVALSAEELDRHAAEAVADADGILWRRALAGAAAAELGLGLGEAIGHPAVRRAQQEVGAPPYPGDPVPSHPEDTSLPPEVPSEPPEDASLPPEPDALRVAAVHLGGIEALRAGERDLELRISSAGLDVIKRSSGAPIGRLEWAEVETVDLSRGRRGLRPGRRAYELHVATRRGRASFQLPGVTEEQLTNHLQPTLARARGAV